MYEVLPEIYRHCDFINVIRKAVDDLRNKGGLNGTYLRTNAYSYISA